jgi:hypothetical protein
LGLAALGTAGAVAMSGGAGGGTAASGAAESAGAPKSVSVRMKRAKESARKGKADDAWRKMKLKKKAKDVAENALDCAINSYGRVRDFFLRNPCKSLDRTLITLVDPAGGTFVVSVSWVRMRNKDDVGDLKTLIDTNGTGSVAPLMFGALKRQGVRFTGTPFHSRPEKDVLVVAEAAVVSGRPDADLMDDTVHVAAELVPAK